MLSFLFVVINGILVLYLTWRANDVRRLMRRKRFELRPSLPLDVIYAKTLAKNLDLNMDFSGFCKHWGRIAAIMDCDPLKLRAEDSFSGTLSAVKGFPSEDVCAEVFEYLREQLNLKREQFPRHFNELSEIMIALGKSDAERTKICKAVKSTGCKAHCRGGSV